MRATIYDFVVKDENNEDVSLAKYEGKVLLIINSATECGFTEQYDELQPLFERYEARGLVILDFPCNQFHHQAPGTIKEIINYCDMEYAITFPILNKVEVNGVGASPLYQYLKAQKGFEGFDEEHPLTPKIIELIAVDYPNYEETSDIKWNFTKFLIDRSGQVVARYEPTQDIGVIEASIQTLL